MSLRSVSEPNAQTLLQNVSKYQATIASLKAQIKDFSEGRLDGEVSEVSAAADQLEKAITTDKALLVRVKEFTAPQIKTRLRTEFESLAGAAKDLKGRIDKAQKAFTAQEQLNSVIVRLGKSGKDAGSLRGKIRDVITKNPDISVSCLENLSNMLITAKQRKKTTEERFTTDAMAEFMKELAEANNNNERLKTAVGHLPKSLRDEIYSAICSHNQKSDDRDWAKSHLAENLGLIKSVAAMFSDPTDGHSSSSSSSSTSSISSGEKVKSDGKITVRIDTAKRSGASQSDDTPTAPIEKSPGTPLSPPNASYLNLSFLRSPTDLSTSSHEKETETSISSLPVSGNKIEDTSEVGTKKVSDTEEQDEAIEEEDEIEEGDEENDGETDLAKTSVKSSSTETGNTIKDNSKETGAKKVSGTDKSKPLSDEELASDEEQEENDEANTLLTSAGTSSSLVTSSETENDKSKGAVTKISITDADKTSSKKSVTKVVSDEDVAEDEEEDEEEDDNESTSTTLRSPTLDPKINDEKDWPKVGKKTFATEVASSRAPLSHDKLVAMVEALEKMKADPELMGELNRTKLLQKMHVLFNTNMNQSQKYQIYNYIGEAKGKTGKEADDYGRSHFAEHFDTVLLYMKDLLNPM